MKPKVLIIGLGKIGMMYNFYDKAINYTNHCDAFFNNENFQLVGGVEVSSKKKKLFNKKYKLPCYSNFKVAYKKHKPDILVLSVPTDQLENFFLQITKNNLKPKLILLEKPGAYDYIKLKNFFEYCKIKKIQLFLNYQRSYSLNLSNIRNHLSSSKFGKIKSINIYYHKGFFNSCSHYVNFLFILLKMNNIKNLKILSYKKIKRDYLINLNFKMKYLINLKINVKDQPEKIVFNGSKAKICFFTELSKIYLYLGKKKYLIESDFKNQQLNVLKKIKKLICKKNNFNINNNLKTLKLLNLVTKNL